jgi:hypothetical protein
VTPSLLVGKTRFALEPKNFPVPAPVKPGPRFSDALNVQPSVLVVGRTASMVKLPQTGMSVVGMLA